MYFFSLERSLHYMNLKNLIHFLCFFLLITNRNLCFCQFMLTLEKIWKHKMFLYFFLNVENIKNMNEKKRMKKEQNFSPFKVMQVNFTLVWPESLCFCVLPKLLRLESCIYYIFGKITSLSQLLWKLSGRNTYITADETSLMSTVELQLELENMEVGEWE